MAVSARQTGIRRRIALGTTVVALLILWPVSKKAAFWNVPLLVTIVMVVWTVAIRSPVVRRAFLCLSTVAAMLTMTEALLHELHRPAAGLPAYPPRRRMPDVGDCCAPGGSVRAHRTKDGKTIFDVRYTIDEHGLRVAPPADPEPAATLICFGCSYTFGEGVEDHQSWPYRVGVRSQGRVRVYNFAALGWGPHQALALLEGERVSRTVKPQGRVVGIYLAIWDHLNRCAGRGIYTRTGPRYRLDSRGVARRDGMLADRFPALRRFPQLLKSEIYKLAVLDRTARPDPDLLAALLVAAKRRFEATFQNGDFHVLLWPGPRIKELGALLSRHGLKTRVVVLPPGELTIDGDPHPNARAQDAAAAFVLREVLEMP